MYRPLDTAQSKRAPPAASHALSAEKRKKLYALSVAVNDKARAEGLDFLEVSILLISGVIVC